MTNEFDIPLLDDYTPEKTAEIFRLALARLTELNLPVSPLYYSLFFAYYTGFDSRINESMDKLIDNEQLNVDEARTLALKYMMYCKSTILEELRLQMLDTLNVSLKSISELSGSTSSTNDRLQEHINALQESEKAEDIANTLSSVIQQVTGLLSESKSFEHELKESSDNLDSLKVQLIHARSKAFTDALTGLNNRHSLNEKLEQLIGDRRFRGNGFSMLMVDIDHFKVINDTYGHLTGDKVLKAIAATLTKRTRDTDFVSRFGGEEFIILLPQTSLNNAFRVAESIRTSIQKISVKTRETADSIHALTASFGVAVHREGETADELIDRCDKAMYRAKQGGRDRSMVAQ